MLRWVPFLAVAGLIVAGCSNDTVQPPVGEQLKGRALAQLPVEPARGRVVVANRASGTISVIDATTDAVVGTYDLPAESGEPTPEPMYVVHSSPQNRVFVGDRANSRVVAFDAATFAVDGTVPAGNGVFHMWADPRGLQLWVNNDVGNTTTVVNPVDLTVIATVSTPPDLVAMGGKPHDVVVGPRGQYAYVTVIGVAGDDDYVVQYDTASFTETGRAPVGKDPHVSLARQHNRLYVPCQNSNVVVVLNRFTMEEMTRIDVPGAHGAGMVGNGRYFYTANLPGGGTNALYTIDTRRNALVGDPVDSPYAAPHNIALNPSGSKLYLTHSGPSDKVTVYTMTGSNPVPQYAGEVTVGLNPFGLAYVN